MYSSILQVIGFTALPFIPPKIITKLTGGRQAFRDRSKKLIKPSWYPPPWIFGKVWPCLYTSMGYASYLVYRDGVGKSRNLALSLYASSIVLKTIANPLITQYIGRIANVSALSLLVVNIGACIRSFYPINKLAAYLMVPYLAWSSFAAFLSVNMWLLNREQKN